MKRLLSLFLILSVLFFDVPCSAGENAMSVFSYDFDLCFQLNADVFPARNRAHMRGYAELLDSLELKGNLTWSPDTESIDLHAEIIPVSNQDAAITFRLFGIPEHICISSPLLGDEAIWLHNYVLMEFALKTWNNLKIPLQYLAILYPYVTESAFQNLTDIWQKNIGSVQKSSTVTLSKLKAVAAEWDQLLQQDSRLIYWISALSSVSDDHAVLETEFSRLPSYLLNRVAQNSKLTVTAKNNLIEWRNRNNDVLFTSSEIGGISFWNLSLPATENGYVPLLSCQTESYNQQLSLFMEGSYSLPPSDTDEDHENPTEPASGSGSSEAAVSQEILDEISAYIDKITLPCNDSSEEKASLPESLLRFRLNMDSFPESIPMSSAFSAYLTISGILIPNIDIAVYGDTAMNGEISLSVYQPVEEYTEAVHVASCTGSIIPVEASVIPSFTVDELRSNVGIFFVNDQSLNDFVHRIVRPLFFGILNFLYELPARGCQSVMDDLEDYGILDMLLGQ